MRRKFIIISFVIIIIIMNVSIVFNGCMNELESNKKQTLIIAAYGGEYETLLREVVIEPFEEVYDVKVIIDTAGSGSEKFSKIRASRGSSGWDLVVLTASETILGGKEGLLEIITEKEVPNLKHIYPNIRELVYPYGAVQELQYMGIVYNTNTVKTPPESWNELWKEEYKGRVIIYDPSNLMGVYTLMAAAKTESGNIYDIESGFRKLMELKSNLLTVLISSSDIVRYFSCNQVDISTSWDGRAHYYKDNGVPIDIIVPKEGAFLMIPTLSVPQKAENKELAFKFINFWLSKDIQKKWAEAYKVGPVRPDIELDEEFKKLHLLDENSIKNNYFPDPLFIANRREDIMEVWKKNMIK